MQRINAALTLFVLLIIHPVSVQAQISPWPMFQRDQSHTGRTTSVGPASADTSWTRLLDGDTMGPGTQPVINASGTILIGTMQGHIYAYSATGQRQWKITLPGAISSALGIATDGRMLVSTANDSCYVLDPNGQVLQRLYIGSANSGPTMVGNVAYLTGNYNGAGFVFKIDLDVLWYTGQSGHLWHTDRSSPVISSGGQIAVGTTENILPFVSSGHISVLDANCQEICSYNLGFFNGRGIRSSISQTSTGRFVGGTVGDDASFYGDGVFCNSDISCSGCSSGSGHYFSSPALLSNDVWVIGTSAGISLHDPTGCGQIALYPTGPILNPSPIVDGHGTIYVGDDNGKFWAWSSAGTNLWSRQLDAASTSAAIDAHGNLFVASTLGRLYCFSGPNQTAVGPLSHPPLDQLSVRPNPVRGQTAVQLTLTQDAFVNCAVYDLSGRPVASIYNGPLTSGTRSWTWNGRNNNGQILPAGMYWMTSSTGTKRVTTTIVLLP